MATADRQRDTLFGYWRCAADHGRFITFADFLREKNFVRPLTGRELGSMCEMEVAETAVLECAAFFRFVPDEAAGA